MKVQDVMTPRPITVTTDTPVSKVSLLMKKNRIGGIPVTENGKAVGIVTETDILSLLTMPEINDDLWLPSPFEIIEIPIRELMNWEKTKEALSDVGNMPISDVMSDDLICTSPGMDIEEAASLMMKEGIARLLVIEDEKLVGIVTRADLVRGIGARYGEPEE
ncbi:CBS domain-containing protein [Methanogenium marinum]|uniref:CBS domain-containing protein n=1 Tax=Methanogenium marinum TaxID=348610 RepID=A0A9Q4KVM4_9EURY|nr:CBS domain-containing protein [Methanogenium marinum]MDE4908346.1 CBS domain-containing protein [Methanogenium marinum]